MTIVYKIMSLLNSSWDRPMWKLWFIGALFGVLFVLSLSGVFHPKKEGFKGKGVSFAAAIKISVAVITGVALLTVIFGKFF